MPATLSAPPVRQGQTYTFDGLRDEARLAFERSGKKQGELAEELGKTPPAISLALNKSGAAYVKLQARIIAHLTPFEIEDAPIYRAVRKATD